MKTKAQMIDEIRQLNHTAHPEFLGLFEEQDLKTYLERLTHIFGHRGRCSGWVRPGDTHAVVTSQP